MTPAERLRRLIAHYDAIEAAAEANHDTAYRKARTGLAAHARQVAATIDPADPALRPWLRSLDRRARRLPATEERHRLRLPEDWSPDRELLVLLGPHARPLATLLRGEGHSRVVVADPDLPVRECLQLIATGPFPRHARVHATDPALKASASDLSRHVHHLIDRARLGRNTTRHFGPTWARHGLLNLARVSQAPRAETLNLSGRAAVIVAPGPSLARDVHRLQSRPGLVIIALNRSVDALLKVGVTPDLVVVLDAQDFVAAHLQNVPREVPLALCGVVTPRLFALPNPKLVFETSECDQWLSILLGRQPSYTSPPCGSVAGAATNLALGWGCDPVAFVGLDLSFADRQVYGTGAFESHRRVEVGDDDALHYSDVGRDRSFGRLTHLPGVAADQVETSTTMAVFHRWFERRALASPAALWNCSQGARIKGMRHLPLEQALREIPGRDLPSVRGSIEQLRPAPGRAPIDVLHDLDVRLREAKALAEQAFDGPARERRVLTTRLRARLEALPFLALLPSQPPESPIEERLASIVRAVETVRPWVDEAKNSS